MDNIKRTWWCQECGCGHDEKVGVNRSQGNEGVSTYYCSNCKARTKHDWKIIENTDPTEELEEPSLYCEYCEEVKPSDIMNVEYENYPYPVCNYCIENNNKQRMS